VDVGGADRAAREGKQVGGHAGHREGGGGPWDPREEVPVAGDDPHGDPFTVQAGRLVDDPVVRLGRGVDADGADPFADGGHGRPGTVPGDDDPDLPGLRPGFEEVEQASAGFLPALRVGERLRCPGEAHEQVPAVDQDDGVPGDPFHGGMSYHERARGARRPRGGGSGVTIERAGGGAGLVVTIGHSDRSTEELLELLRRHGVALVVDVRSAPWSRRHPQHSRPALERALAEAGIGYSWLGASLGGLREEGYEAWRRTDEYRRGLDELVSRAARGTVAVLCAERDPAHCHRRFIAEDLQRRGLRVRHVLDRDTFEDLEVFLPF